jgi:SAM-dependent methyltransferase
VIERIPLVGRRAARAVLSLKSNRRDPSSFAGSAPYWERRYGAGGDSGSGSYGRYAAFKAEVLNAFVAEHGVGSVIEFGCGDGNQLALAEYPRYLGVDVSESAVRLCRERFATDPTKSFETLGDYASEQAELSRSLDVIYHLVEDDAFAAHMQTVFGGARRFVGIYSSNVDDGEGGSMAHVRHRRFTDWVDAHAPEWDVLARVPNRYPYRGRLLGGSLADFYFFARHVDARR